MNRFQTFKPPVYMLRCVFVYVCHKRDACLCRNSKFRKYTKYSRILSHTYSIQNELSIVKLTDEFLLLGDCIAM